MTNRHDLGEVLGTALTALEFEKAIALANELANDVTSKVAQDVASDLVKSGDARAKHQETLRHILMIAETYFYNGRTSEAYKLLRPFTEKKAIKAFVDATPDIPMRQRLQLVEYFYSKRELHTATELADQLRKTVHKEPHEARFEEGEVEYFRARIANRSADYAAMVDCAMRALSALTDSNHGSPEMLRVRWRLGQLLLVFGRCARKFGDPGRGDARLHLARWLLHGLSDEMSQANVNRELGSMYRAQGGSDDEAISYRDIAKKHLEEAREVYEKFGHTLNRSRIHRSLGVLYLSQQLYDEAAKEFDTAIDLAKKAGSTRQPEAIKVWKSWLAQEKKKPDLDKAIDCGKSAIENLKSEEAPDVCVDAHLAVGSAYFVKHDFGQAELHFKEGLKIAKKHGLKKHQINVHLSLAHLCERRSDIREAWDHYHAAMRVVPDNKFPDSRFLRKKKQDVREALEKSETFHLSFEECLQKDRPLQYWQKELESWLIKQAHKREDGKIGKVAEKLDIPRQRVSKCIKEKKL